MTYMRNVESKNRKEKKLEYVTSHVCAQTTHIELPDVVNSAKFHQNRLRDFWSTKSQISSFSYA